MRTLRRLLTISTVLSSVASLHMAGRAAANGISASDPHALSDQAIIRLAQAVEPEKPEGAPKKPPAAPTKPPAGAPAPPTQKPAAPPPAAKPAPPPTAPAPPPAKPSAPPAAAPSAPRVAPPAAHEQAPSAPSRPVAPPPAAQTPPQAKPPAAQSQSPAAPSRPAVPPAAQAPAPSRPSSAAPPAAQSAPPAASPPAAQGQPPAVPGRPVAPAAQTKPQSTPPAAQGAATPASPAGVAPNTQSAPLTPAGIPAASPQQARPIAPAAPGAGLSPQSAQGQPLRRVEELRGERRESTEGGRTIIREPDRTIIREGGQTVIRHSETDRFRYGAQEVRVERRGTENVTIVLRPNGDRIVTVLDENGFLLRRSRILPNGREIILIDNRPRGPGFRGGNGYGGFFVELPPPVIRIPRERYIVDDDQANPELIYETLIAPPIDVIERPYSLDEIRFSAPLRDRMRRIDLNTVTFDTGSWELSPDQVQRLAGIAAGLNRAIDHNPREIFLIEGYTDAVGSDIDNLSLSDRRAESVAIALTQQFGVPGENLSTQGYGEQYLKIPTSGPERANRRVTVRRITPLLAGGAPRPR